MSGRNEITWKVAERAWKDEEFRSALQSDPRTTIQNELGLSLPEGVEIEVVHESPTKLYIVIPANPNAASDELSSEELDQVAGGLGGGDVLPVRCPRGSATQIDATNLNMCQTWSCTVRPSSTGCSDC